MEQIIQEAEKRLDNVLNFYKRLETPLSYRPKLQYIDTIYGLRPDTIAQVIGELEMVKNYSDFLYKNIMKNVCKEIYKLDISDLAITEITNIQKNKLHELNNLIPKEFEGDIILFQPYKQADRDATILHETWHLIEKERGVLQKHPFIMEGTATYAEKRALRKKCDTPPSRFGDFFSMIYYGAANIVQNHVQNSKNPYKAMLELDVREQIQQELLEKVKPVIANQLKKTLGDENVKKGLAYQMQQNPKFQKLKNNLTAEGIIEIYREMGANQLAKELEKQNLESLLDSFKQIGF
jgi:hypothetical protein